MNRSEAHRRLPFLRETASMGTARRIRDDVRIVGMLPMQVQKAGRVRKESVQVFETEEKEVKRGDK